MHACMHLFTAALLALTNASLYCCEMLYWLDEYITASLYWLVLMHLLTAALLALTTACFTGCLLAASLDCQLY